MSGALDTLAAHVEKGLADMPGAEPVGYRPGASDSSTAFPFTQVDGYVLQGGPDLSTTLSALDGRRGKWPLRVMLFRHQIASIREGYDQIAWPWPETNKTLVYTVRAVLYETPGMWDVYCAR